VEKECEDARLEEDDEEHEGHADEDHGHGEAPVCGGDGELGDAKDGLSSNVSKAHNYHNKYHK
jgi:hypothetical protein